MSERDQLIEDILDVALLSLQTARTSEGRREIMVIMNYVKSRRSTERVRGMELDCMARALNE